VDGLSSFHIIIMDSGIGGGGGAVEFIASCRSRVVTWKETERAREREHE
jgi:hypothetical protein